MYIPARDKRVLEASGATVLNIEYRSDQKGILAYHVEYQGEQYRWAVSSVGRNVPPWKFSKKPSKKYIYGNRNFIYKMSDDEGNILYIGKTSQLDYRLYAHFYKNPDEWKSYVTKVEVCEFDSEADMHVYEMYLVTKYDPIFNRHARTKDKLSISLPDITFVEISDWK